MVSFGVSPRRCAPCIGPSDALHRPQAGGYNRTRDLVTAPVCYSLGGRTFRSASMKRNPSGGAAHRNVASIGPASLTGIVFNWNNVPDPESGVKSAE